MLSIYFSLLQHSIFRTSYSSQYTRILKNTTRSHHSPANAAFRKELDLDAPEAIDFDVLVDRGQDVTQGLKLYQKPWYQEHRSFEVQATIHARRMSRANEKTTSIWPHELKLPRIILAADATQHARRVS